jgi:hypothetical protein
MNITFHTNLDEAKSYVFYQTEKLPWTHVPAVGSLIRFALPIEPKGSTFSLEVVEVSYSADGQECTVELHIPSHMRMGVDEWSKWLRHRFGWSV